MCWAHCHTSIITKDSVEAGSLKVYNDLHYAEVIESINN
jgi:hypothetical protein